MTSLQGMPPWRWLFAYLYLCSIAIIAMLGWLAIRG